jgi:hypothetical protein
LYAPENTRMWKGQRFCRTCERLRIRKPDPNKAEKAHTYYVRNREKILKRQSDKRKHANSQCLDS